MGLFGSAFTGWHLVIIIAVLLLLFGAPKLPGLAKSVGQSMKIFRSEVRSMREDDDAPKSESTESATNTTVTPAATVVTTPTAEQHKQ